MFSLEKVVNFMRKGSYIILSLIISRIVDSLYGDWAGEVVFWLITGVISGIKYLKRRDATALIDTYMVEKGFRDYKLLNVEDKGNGLWTAECMVLDYEKYFDDLKFDVEVYTWSGRYFDNFTEKEQEHFLKYPNNEVQEEVVNEIEEEEILEVI